MKLSDFSREARIVDLERKELHEKLLKEATLSLDFANNTYEVYEGPVDGLTQRPLKDVLNFTRGSEATVRTATGKIQTVGVDDQRLVGNREGLLIEEQRTNLLLWSEDLTRPVWVKNGVTVTPEGTAPNGATAYRIESSGLGSDRLEQSFSIPPDSSAYTLSVFIRGGASDSAGSLNLRLFGGSNLEVFSSEPVIEDGWQKFSVSLANDGTNSQASVRVLRGYADDTGIATRSAVYSLPQLEVGLSPSSYIKTEGTQVTRAEETASLTDFADWHGSEGTFHCEVKDVANVVGLFEVNGTPLLENVSGSGTLTITYDRNNNQKLYVDGELVYTLSSYHGIDLVNIMDTKLVDGGVATCQLVTYIPRQLSAYEISVIGGNL